MDKKVDNNKPEVVEDSFHEHIDHMLEHNLEPLFELLFEAHWHDGDPHKTREYYTHIQMNLIGQLNQCEEEFHSTICPKHRAEQLKEFIDQYYGYEPEDWSKN